jgi:hypothetical protein
MDMNRATRLFILSLIFSGLTPRLSSGDDSNPPPAAVLGAELSADNFDWREMVPYLFEAATLPAEQGIQAVLENSSVLRAYVANEVRAECRREENPCATKDDSVTLEREVGKRIDEIVKEGFFERHKAAIVDYQLTRRPFPFSEIAAVKSEKHPDAYLMLALADHSYTAAQLEAKYGDPYDTDIYQWYSIFKYRLDGPGYTSKAVFEIDPVDGAVIKVAISLKPKKQKSPH